MNKLILWQVIIIKHVYISSNIMNQYFVCSYTHVYSKKVIYILVQMISFFILDN